MVTLSAGDNEVGMVAFVDVTKSDVREYWVLGSNSSRIVSTTVPALHWCAKTMTQYMNRSIVAAKVMRGKRMREGTVPMADAATLRQATATAMRRIISSVIKKQIPVSAQSTYVM